MKMVKAKLAKGISRMGWTPYYLVDKQGRVLNTEPVCTVPNGWHEWFNKHLETVETDYLGFDDEPKESEG